MKKVTHDELADAVAREQEELHVIAARERMPAASCSSSIGARNLRLSDLRRAVDRWRTLGDSRWRVAILVLRVHSGHSAAASVMQREAERAQRRPVRSARRHRLHLECLLE